jgi:hypothetical protein
MASLFTLLHILVLVYWLGGDLGAFYSAGYLVDPARSVAERRLALEILRAIDMAPRTALILALPTGVSLAWAKAWLVLPPTMLVALWGACLAWLGLAWAIHLRHATGSSVLGRADSVVRWVVLSGLSVLGVLGCARLIGVPLFIALKMLVLAACIGAGLLVRRQLVPLFPAVRAMFSGGATAGTDAVIAGVIGRTRPTVVVLWLMLLLAAALGIARPL